MARHPSLLYLCWLSIIAFTHTLAQSVGFTIYPQQVVTGQTYTVSWESNGQPATIELLRGGSIEDTLFSSDGTTNSFQWSVQDDYNGATDYALQLSSGGTTVVADNLYVIEDEDGLVVSGSTITLPSPTATPTATTGLSVSASTTASQPSSTGSSTQTASTTTSTSPSSTPSGTCSPVGSSGGLKGGAIAGIVIGILLLLLLCAGAFWLYRRRKFGRPTYSGPDAVASFLALGRNGPVSGTIKGTSPEVTTTLADGSGSTGDRTEVAELPGEQTVYWYKPYRETSVMTRMFEVNRKPARFELPTEQHQV